MPYVQAEAWNLTNFSKNNIFSPNDINELQKVQKTVLRLSTTPIESVPLEQRRLEADLCEAHQRLSGLI